MIKHSLVRSNSGGDVPNPNSDPNYIKIERAMKRRKMKWEAWELNGGFNIWMHKDEELCFQPKSLTDIQ